MNSSDKDKPIAERKNALASRFDRSFAPRGAVCSMDPFDEPDEDHESYAMMTTQVTSKLQKRVPGLYIKIQLMIGVAETIDV